MKPWIVVMPAGLLLGCSLLGGQGSTAEVLAPHKWHGKPRDSVQDRLVLYYFGASDCPSCNAPQNIELLRQLKARLPGAHQHLLVKTVLICLDHDFERAREFAAKYGAWDEISVGSDWFNELTQHYLAKSKANVIPHVMVFRDSDGFDPAPERGHSLKRRLLVGDYLVGPELEEWIGQGMPLWHLGTLVGESDGEIPRFDGRWRSSKARNPNQVAEVLELDVIPLSVRERFRLDLREDGESSSIQCSDAILSTSGRLTFTAKDDSTTATGECVLSLDGRRMRLVLAATHWMERTMILDRVAE